MGKSTLENLQREIVHLAKALILNRTVILPTSVIVLLPHPYRLWTSAAMRRTRRVRASLV